MKTCIINSNPSNQSRSFLSLFFPLLLFTAIMIFPWVEGSCAQVTLAWDPNSESDLAGYEIYYGTQSGNYQWNVDVGNVPNYTLTGLNTGVTYYISATAYNTKGLESGFSNEVVYTVPSACTYSLSPANASFSTSGGSGNAAISTQTGCNWSTSASTSWITVTSGSGTGSGTMKYTVASNTGASRTASLTIAGNVFTVTQAGLSGYVISASAGTGGTISPSGSISVQSGASQAFSITPNTGYRISGVTVDGASKGAVSSYTFSSVSANHTIAASFTRSTSTSYTLTINKTGTGSGSVTTSPTGTTFPSGTGVTLIAAPDTNSVFSGWSGACSGTSSTCRVTMNSNLTVTANFSPKTYTYTITASARWHGSISPSGSISVQSGASQAFSITPNTGYRVYDLTVDGVSRGAISSYTFSSVSANHTIAASFTRGTSTSYALTINKTGTGSGSVTTNPPGTSFSSGTVVTLTAAPDAHSVFSGWSGACSGTNSTCQLTMNSNLSVTATFSAISSNPPAVTTNSATSVTSNSATINGTVNPNGLPTTYLFQWGSTTSYGNATVVTSSGSATNSLTVSATLSGLTAYRTYHYRVVATNSAGTTYGADLTFYTRSTWRRR